MLTVALLEDYVSFVSELLIVFSLYYAETNNHLLLLLFSDHSWSDYSHYKQIKCDTNEGLKDPTLKLC